MHHLGEDEKYIIFTNWKLTYDKRRAFKKKGILDRLNEMHSNTFACFLVWFLFEKIENFDVIDCDELNVKCASMEFYNK